MAFWGVEVKAGVPLKVELEQEASIHLSQVALGELKKNEIVSVFATVDGQKLVLGHLSAEKMPQLSFDLVFDREFELSHNSKSSVFFIGYQAPEYETDFDDEEDEHEHELVHFTNAANAIQLSDDKKAPATAPKPNNVKPDSSSKQKSKSVQPVKGESESDDSDEDDSDDESGDSESDDEERSEEGMSVDSGEDDSHSEDEETPKKAGKGSNKRPIDSAPETPVQVKKQKSATPQKSEGKKSVHTATPHPAKGKTSANGPNTKSFTSTKPQTTPKSDGKFSCGSCDRAFGSDAALQSHSKVKHSAK